MGIGLPRTSPSHGTASDDDSSAATRGRQPVRKRRLKPIARRHKASEVIDLADRLSSEGSAIGVHCLAHISLAEFHR